MKKPILNYPCKWPFKVIGSDKAVIEEEISIRLDHIEYRIEISNQSKKGKYISWQVEADVASEKQRNDIFNILKEIPTVKVVF